MSQSRPRESAAMRLLRHAEGWTRGPRCESPDLVPSRVESRPFGPRSSRLRCRPASAIPEPVRPLFVRGPAGTRLSCCVLCSWPSLSARMGELCLLHGMVHHGTPAIGSLMPPTPSTPLTLSRHVTVYRQTLVPAH